MIECKNLGVVLEGKKVLEGIDLTVEDGEILGILGPAGSGKTIIAMAMAGLVRDHSGEVTVDGVPVKELAKERMDDGISYVRPSVPGNLEDTLMDFLFLARIRFKKVFRNYSDYDLQVVEKYADLIGLKGHEGAPLRTLSDSIVRKAVIAHSLIRDSKILVMDDPTAFLDLESVSRLIKAIKIYVMGGDKTVVLAGNDVNFMLQSCDRLVFLEPDGGAPAVMRPDAVTAEIVRQCFGTEVLLSRNIYNGRPEIHLFAE